ncbi:MAG: DUF262 domain-containing protein [Gemmatimonadales bacterium]|jgi:hypothetical protein|nr:DUF262 domain-containing protein [Gemmatimonadales bacterium]
MKISSALVYIDIGQLALPEFQRGYVWRRDQVRALMQSLYRNDPVGTLLIWSTDADPQHVRGVSDNDSGSVVKLLLDGQQRITSLYGIMRGQAPPFFQGNTSSFTDLYFNVDTETFEFYGPVKMRDDPTWVSVTRIFVDNLSEITKGIQKVELDSDRAFLHMERLNSIRSIGDREIHVDDITGRDRTIDEVVEIFNRINSGGTKLSSGDLALARICADWPQAREALMGIRSTWAEHGYEFSLDWLLRCVTAVGTDQARFPGLTHLSVDEFVSALTDTEKHIDFLLNLVGARLGLDHDRVLGGRGAFAALAWYVHNHGGNITDHTEQQKILYWYLHCLMWGRYSSSVVSILQRDLEALEGDGIDGAIKELENWRGDLQVRTTDFDWSTTGARFYPILYMLTRTQGAKDLLTGIELRENLLGKQSQLHLHHIFPKAPLYKAGYDRKQVNALANMCFLTAASNLKISDTDPAKYLPEIAASQPGVLESQWITTDPDLWSIDRFPEFLADRRERLTRTTNEFLVGLLSGHEAYEAEVTATASIAATPTAEDDLSYDTALVLEIAARHELTAPGVDGEIADVETGEPITTADLVWADGVQAGLTDPVAFVPSVDGSTAAALSAAGYRVFTSRQALVWYLEGLLGTDIDGDEVVGDPNEV